MRSLSSKNWGIKFLLYVIDVFTKYAWLNGYMVKPLKDKKAKTVLHDFNEIVNESKCKLNELWVYQEREFYNSLIQKHFRQSLDI